MDNRTLKLLIVQLRDEEELTFQEISDRLNKEYSVIRSRQAIQGMYQRAKKSNSITKDIQYESLVIDVINLYCLGYNMTDISNKVEKLGHKCTYNMIVDIIKKQKSSIEDINKSNIEKIEDKVNNSDYIGDIKGCLSYKGYSITDKKLKELVGEVYKNKIKNSIQDIIIELYGYTDSCEIKRQIVKDLGLQHIIK